MNSTWFKGYKTAEKEARKKELLSYKNAFEELTKVLEKEFEESVPDYNNPSWSHSQADVNGANRKLRQVLDLINLKD